MTVEIMNLAGRLRVTDKRVAELEAELNIGKQAYADLLVNSAREIRILKDEIQELEQQL